MKIFVETISVHFFLQNLDEREMKDLVNLFKFNNFQTFK